MFSNESLITIIRQLVVHHGLEPNEVVSVFVNAIDRVVRGAETSSQDLYEMVVEILITGEIEWRN